MSPHEFRRALERRAKKLKEMNSNPANLTIHHNIVTNNSIKPNFFQKVKGFLKKRK